METRIRLALPAVFIAFMIASSSISVNYLMAWWSSYVSSFWNSLFHQFGSLVTNSPAITAQQEFTSQLASVQNKTRLFSNFYVTNAESYARQFVKSRLNLNESWSIQITDRNSTTSPIIGNMTVSWRGTSRNLTITKGIADNNISPTYYVTATHKAFMALSKDAVNLDFFSAFADYMSYNSSGSLKYGRVR
jgi:hypothetical protein